VDDPTSALAVVETRTDGVGRAELIGVQLGIRLEKGRPADYKTDALFVLPSVVASLKWGIGSVEFAAECDWMHGTQIGLLAENVAVAARYVKNTRPWAPEESEVQPSFLVSAGVAYGTMPRNSSGARLTKIAQLENTNDTIDFPIPPFAISFTVIPFFGAAVAVSVRSFGLYAADYAIATPLSNAGQHNVENSFPLFNGAEFLTVQNIQQQPAVAAVVFGLAL
jgi:hypothetical protein